MPSSWGLMSKCRNYMILCVTHACSSKPELTVNCMIDPVLIMQKQWFQFIIYSRLLTEIYL